MFKHKCEMCGMEFESKSNRAKYCIYCRDKAQTYTVNSGSQKYCKDCTKKQQQASKGKPSAEYIKENYDYIRFNVPKGEGDAIKAYAQEHGMTIKQLLLTALKEYQENHESK